MRHPTHRLVAVAAVAMLTAGCTLLDDDNDSDDKTIRIRLEVMVTTCAPEAEAPAEIRECADLPLTLGTVVLSSQGESLWTGELDEFRGGIEARIPVVDELEYRVTSPLFEEAVTSADPITPATTSEHIVTVTEGIYMLTDIRD